jgi:hypothetical protein
LDLRVQSPACNRYTRGECLKAGEGFRTPGLLLREEMLPPLSYARNAGSPGYTSATPACRPKPARSGNPAAPAVRPSLWLPALGRGDLSPSLPIGAWRGAQAGTSRFELESTGSGPVVLPLHHVPVKMFLYWVVVGKVRPQLPNIELERLQARAGKAGCPCLQSENVFRGNPSAGKRSLNN